jgi:hypothetical protein
MRLFKNRRQGATRRWRKGGRRWEDREDARAPAQADPEEVLFGTAAGGAGIAFRVREMKKPTPPDEPTVELVALPGGGFWFRERPAPPAPPKPDPVELAARQVTALDMARLRADLRQRFLHATWQEGENVVVERVRLRRPAGPSPRD